MFSVGVALAPAHTSIIDQDDDHDDGHDEDHDDDHGDGHNDDHDDDRIDLVASPCKKTVENIHRVVAGSLQDEPDRN